MLDRVGLNNIGQVNTLVVLQLCFVRGSVAEIKLVEYHLL